MRHLNIAFYTDTFFPAVDGVVTSIEGFTKELEGRGHHVYIFTAGKPGSANSDPNVFYTRGIQLKRYPQYTFAMFPFLPVAKTRKLKIDIIHAQTPFSMGMSALITAKVNRIPLVGTFHTLFTSKTVIDEYTVSNNMARKLANKYSWSYARFFYNMCDKVIAPSGTISSVLKRKGIPNVSVVENGIDRRIFNERIPGTAVRRQFLDKGHGKIVLYVGRISKEKRLDVMIKAAKRLKGRGIRFVAVGNGPAMDYYADMVRKYGLESDFKFLGFVPHSELPKYYAAADLFCIPSTFETQGIVSLEAMSMGKPVVGADYLALSELIRPGKNGEKFTSGDSAACARKIERVINDTDRYKETVVTAEKYSIEKVTDKLLDVYNGLLDPR